MIQRGLAGRGQIGGGLAVARGYGLGSSYQWWDDDGAISGCVGAWQAKGAASLAASYADLSGGGNNLTAGVAPTWSTATGWGLAAGELWHLDTGVIISTSTTWSFLVRYSDANSSSGNALGIYGGAANLRLQIDVFNPPANIGFGNGNLNSAFAGADTGDHVAGIVGSNGYFDGTSRVAITTGGSHSNNAYIGALNEADAANYHLQYGYIKAVAIYNVTLSAPDAATISAAMAAL